MLLEGSLVRLRAREPGDVDRVYEWVNDPEVTQHLSIRYPLSHGDQERWLESTPTNSSGRVALAIETKDGEHIGSIDLREVSAENRRAELAIMIGHKPSWSRGYGTDAIMTLLRFAFSEMNLNRVWLTVDADNERAIACYRKCGFVEEGRLRQNVYKHGQYLDVVLMGVLREEFEALRGD